MNRSRCLVANRSHRCKGQEIVGNQGQPISTIMPVLVLAPCDFLDISPISLEDVSVGLRHKKMAGQENQCRASDGAMNLVLAVFETKVETATGRERRIVASVRELHNAETQKQAMEFLVCGVTHHRVVDG